VVVVGCHGTGGALTDSAFSMAYTNNEVPSRRHGAYARADATVAGAPPDWFSTTGGVVVTRRPDPARPGELLAGVYDVVLSGMPPSDDTNVVVTAHGSGATTCKVSSWGPTAPPGTVVTVLCHAWSGTAANRPFSLLYTTNRPV
jgi:hypothetical protein